MSEGGQNLRMASGARRLTIHCHYCGASLSAPLEADLWVWLKSPTAKEFYRYHREHSGAFADQVVGAEIEYDDGLVPKKQDNLPPLMNLLSEEGMQAMAAFKK